MDDTGADIIRTGGQILKMIHQAVNQCAAFVTACRMDNHIRLFIQDEDVVVFIEQVDRDIFRDEFPDFPRRQNQVNLVSGLEFMAGLGGATVDIDPLLLDKLLQASSAKTAKPAAKVRVVFQIDDVIV